MQIINNKIYILKGETPTYNVSVIDKDTGAPFRLPILPDGKDRKWVVEFIVRPSVYDREDDYVMKVLLLRKDKQFETDKIETYKKGSDLEPLWQPDYFFGDPLDPETELKKKALYRGEVISGSGVWEYAYFDGEKWVPYEFRINFMFPYNNTSNMDVKTYKYEVALFGGVGSFPSVKDITYDTDLGMNIEYKKVLLSSNDFVVGGSSSE